jgi:hypothetical protein
MAKSTLLSRFARAVLAQKHRAGGRQFLALIVVMCLAASPSTQPAEPTTVADLLSSAVPSDLVATGRREWTPAVRKAILDHLDKLVGDSDSKHLRVAVSFIVEETHRVDPSDARLSMLKPDKPYYAVWGRLHPFRGVPVRILCSMDVQPKVGDRITFTAPLTFASFELDDSKPPGAWFLVSFNNASVKG